MVWRLEPVRYRRSLRSLRTGASGARLGRPRHRRPIHHFLSCDCLQYLVWRNRSGHCYHFALRRPCARICRRQFSCGSRYLDSYFLFLAMAGMMVWVIAELRAAQTRAETASRPISHILETVQDGFIALDANWRYTYINAAAERMQGRDRYQLLLGTPILNRFPDYAGTEIEEVFPPRLA